jgi:hypothetical protein
MGLWIEPMIVGGAIVRAIETGTVLDLRHASEPIPTAEYWPTSYIARRGPSGGLSPDIKPTHSA